MDKIFHSTFDFFTHALPGSFIVAALFLLSPEITTPRQYLEIASTLTAGAGILLLAVGYVLGFAIYPLGRALYKHLGRRIWPKQMQHDIPIFISEKYTLIREFSPANFKYVELWNMFCAMSHNLAIAGLLLAICCFLKVAMWSVPQTSVWVGFGVLALALALIFTQRAVVFAIWAADDLNSTISRLDLADRKLESDDQ